MSKTTLENEWKLADDIIHLNHAAVAPWPQRTKAAIEDFVNQNTTIGSKHYLKWIETETQLRRQLKRLINAPSSKDIALLKNTSEALSVVAYGLPWQSGDNVVISDQEFPSNSIVWESLSPRFGVEVRKANLWDDESPEDALIKQCNANTKLLSISSIQYASGLRMDLQRLGEFCRDNDILFCVDAIQSLGAFEIDVQKIHADFVMGDAHKWMLGPEGVALFYTTADSRERLTLQQFGWHMVESVGDFDATSWEIAASARRFECGSSNMLGIHAFNASISLLLEIGMQSVEEQILSRVRTLHDFLNAFDNVIINSPQQLERLSGIVNFTVTNKDLESVYSHLQSAGVLCAMRGGGIRFSPHYYTPINKIKTAVELAAK